MWHAEVLNSADFGVPQTRRSLILRAVRDALLPGLAAPERWVGWYAATKDIKLPEKKLPKNTIATAENARKQHTTFLIGMDTGFHDTCFRAADEPAMTLRTQSRGMTVVVGEQVFNTTVEWSARITSLPVDYIFPCNSTQAIEVIGNMVPSLMMQRIVEPLL
jgi:site-specific DNA-cytosine methylase